MSGESSPNTPLTGAPTDRYSNLSWSTDDQALAQTFEQFGSIEKAVSFAAQTGDLQRRVLTQRHRPLS